MTLLNWSSTHRLIEAVELNNPNLVFSGEGLAIVDPENFPGPDGPDVAGEVEGVRVVEEKQSQKFAWEMKSEVRGLILGFMTQFCPGQHS